MIRPTLTSTGKSARYSARSKMHDTVFTPESLKAQQISPRHVRRTIVQKLE